MDSVKSGSLNINWTRNSPHQLEIHLKDTLQVDYRDSLSIYYSGIPQSDGLGSFVNDTLSDSSKISWSLSQPYGAKNWWPSKNSLSDKWNQFEILVETPLKYKVASNGLLQKIDSLGDLHTFHWKTNYPIADYLIAIAVGEYEILEHYETLRGDSLFYQHFLYPFDSLSIKQSKEVTPVFMQYFDSLFGPYPFIDEKYGHATFTFGGGMEHQTMSFMGSYGGELIAHELAHQWFGNLITCNSWQDLWLNEAFAIYATHLTYEFDILHDSRYLNVSLSNFKNAAFDFPNSSVFIKDTTTSNQMFTRLPYYKGAALLHMIRWQIGDSSFFQAIRNYVADTNIRFGFASTKVLQQHFENSGQIDLSEFFRDWYYGKGFPTYHLAWEQNGNDLKMVIEQTQSDPSVYFFNMPIPYQIKASDWDTLIIVNPKFSNEMFRLSLDKTVDSIIFDPEQWIAAKSTIVSNIKENKNLNQLKIYPNPTTGTFHIFSNNVKNFTNYQLYDVHGREILSGKLKSFRKSIDLSNHPNGIYLVIFDNGESTKIVKH